MVVIIVLIITLVILAIGLDIRIKDIKRIKEIGYDKELNNITNKLPDNVSICKEILKMLNNESVIIEEQADKNDKTSLYLVMSNKILIANIKDTFTRVQTIAHECIHSIQNKKMLIFNFVFSNLYILYFFIACILAITGVIKNVNVLNMLFIILMLGGAIFYIVRNFLEIDAMTRARFIAKEYIENTNILSEKEINKVIEKYDELNSIGIKLYSYSLAAQSILKVLIFAIILLI